MPKKKPQAIPDKLLKYIDAAKINYKVIGHRTVFTAFDAAATLKRALDDIAKALIVVAGNFGAIVIMPAHARLDEKKVTKVLKDNFGIKVTAKIPKEKVAHKIIKDEKRPVGAFGSFYKLPVVMDKSLASRRLVVFPSASFNNSIEMLAKDFIKLEQAIVGSFAQMNKIKPQKPQKKTTKKKIVKKVKKKVKVKRRK